MASAIRRALLPPKGSESSRPKGATGRTGEPPPREEREGQRQAKAGGQQWPDNSDPDGSAWWEQQGWQQGWSPY